MLPTIQSVALRGVATYASSSLSINLFTSNRCGQLTCLISNKISSRNYHQYWKESDSTANIYMPENPDDRLLPQMPHTPEQWPPGIMPPYKFEKRNEEMRGPERIHNQLIYRQFGLIALGGGAFKGAHFDVISNRVNMYLNKERFFAVWRLDPPWKPVSKMSLNKRMGGGKSKVHHYETPIKAGRILIEIGGIGDFGEIQWILDSVSKRLPIYVMPVTQQMIDQIKMDKMEIDAKNYNPFEYRDLVRRNFSNSQSKLSPFEEIWGGTVYY